MEGSVLPQGSRPLPPLPEGIERSRPGSFPVAVLDGARTAAAFYAAGFYGAYDVTHLDAAGIADLTLIDLNAEKLEAMRPVYPSVKTVIVADAVATAEDMRGRGMCFDIVVCDPYSNHTLEMGTVNFSLYRSLTRHAYIFGVTAIDLSEIGAEPSERSIAQTLTRLHGQPIDVLAMVKRSENYGGMWWIAVAGEGTRT